MISDQSSENTILQENIDLIHLVIMSIGNPQLHPMLERNLTEAEKNGWETLVQVIRRIISGERNPGEFQELDPEDTVIVNGILAGLKNPEALPSLSSAIEPERFGVSIANLIHATNTGSDDAREQVKLMKAHFASCGDPLNEISMRIPNLLNGERDQQDLCHDMGINGQAIMQSTIEELKRLESGSAV